MPIGGEHSRSSVIAHCLMLHFHWYFHFRIYYFLGYNLFKLYPNPFIVPETFKTFIFSLETAKAALILSTNSLLTAKTVRELDIINSGAAPAHPSMPI